MTKTGSHSKLVNSGGCSVDVAEMAVVIRSGHISSFKEEQNITRGFSPLLTDSGKSLAKLCRASWLAIGGGQLSLGLMLLPTCSTSNKGIDLSCFTCDGQTVCPITFQFIILKGPPLSEHSGSALFQTDAQFSTT